MSVKEVLDQAQKYAQKSGKPILVGITNHDTIDDTKKAIEIISTNPQKYKDILFAPSVEMSAKYKNPILSKQELGENHAFQLENIAYCINPFDEQLNNFLETRRDKNREYVRNIIELLKKYGLDVSYAEALNFGSNARQNHIKYMGSPGIMDILKSYLLSKTQGSSDKTEQIFKKHIADNGSMNLMPSTPGFDEIIKLVSDSGYGFVGIAHPARINLNGTVKTGDETIKTLIDDFIKAGGKLIEYHYQYSGVETNKGLADWINLINEYHQIKYSDVLKAGGLDSHCKTIFGK
jgi:predicted metal-dependent phosphoesterase TrpH